MNAVLLGMFIVMLIWDLAEEKWLSSGIDCAGIIMLFYQLIKVTQ